MVYMQRNVRAAPQYTEQMPRTAGNKSPTDVILNIHP